MCPQKLATKEGNIGFTVSSMESSLASIVLDGGVKITRKAL